MVNEESKITLHSSCKIYKGICNCGETYIGETIRNVEERWSKHNSTDNKSVPAKHLADNKEHPFFGVFYLLLQKMAKHLKIKTIPQQTGGL